MSDDVIVQIVDDFGEHIGRVEFFGRWRVIRMEQKHFIHADVECLGLEGVDQLVDQGEDDFVRLGIHRIPFAAIESFVVGKGARRQIEFRVLREQRACVLCPRLVAEALELRDELDAVVRHMFLESVVRRPW